MPSPAISGRHYMVNQEYASRGIISLHQDVIPLAINLKVSHYHQYYHVYISTYKSFSCCMHSPPLMQNRAVHIQDPYRQIFDVPTLCSMFNSIYPINPTLPLLSTRYPLTTNTRVVTSENGSESDFASNLLKLGDWAIELLPTGEISIQDTIGNIVDSRDALLSTIYPDIAMNFNDLSWLKERAILAPRNDTVGEINSLLLEKIPGHSTEYLSMDTVMEDDFGEYPVEFLNSSKPSSMPNHLLRLKAGLPVVLLRNLDALKICNGTRLIIQDSKDTSSRQRY